MCLAHTLRVFCETGSVIRKKYDGRPSIATEGLIIDVRNHMEEDPRKPLRRLAQEIGVSYETCRTVVRMNTHPYKMQSHQTLLEQQTIPDVLRTANGSSII
ncbi:hypothetical protein Trydic_g8076 [Trypoxylus dichotomus]